MERIQSVEPDYPDPDGLLDSARAALEAEERARKLAALYEQGVQHIDARQWSEALHCLEQVAGLEQGYRETEALLARVRRELEPARQGIQPATRPGARSWPVWAWVFGSVLALIVLGGSFLGIRAASAAPACTH